MPAWLRTPSARWRAAVAVGLAVFVAGSAVRYADKVSHKKDRQGGQTKSAFLRWRDQIKAFEAGDDIYQQFHYPNPPIQALILAPFARLDPVPGALLWFTLKLGMAAAAWVWAVRLSRDGPEPIPLWALVAAGLFTLHPVQGDLSHGNVNIFIAFLVFGSLEAFRRGYDITAGLALALAVGCKVTPALFLPYFLWKRAWRLSAAAAVGLVLWLAVVPAAALGWGRGQTPAEGWDHNRTLLTSWYTTMVKPFLVDGQVTSEHANQSLPGLTVRLLTHAPSDVNYDEDDHRPVAAGFHNLTDIGPANARLLIRGYQAVYVVAGLLLLRARLTGPGAARQGLRVAAEFSYVILGMLLFSERTWKHHGVVLMLPFLVAAAFLAVRRPPGLVRAGLAVLNTIVFALIAVPSAWGDKVQDTALAYGSHTAVFLILLAEVVVILGWENRRAATVGPAGPGPSASPAGPGFGPGPPG